MKFIALLIAVYVYFSFALLDSFKNFSYYSAPASSTFVTQKAQPEKTEGAKVVVTKTAFSGEKSGFSL